MRLPYSIYNKVELLWRTLETWPDYIEVMQSALASISPVATQTTATHRQWMYLPVLCCQSAGGDPHLAEPVAAAWELLRITARLLDSIEDGDTPDVWWANLGPGPAINAAIGLLVSGFLFINRLCRQGISETVVISIANDFYQSLLRACCGQHCDLTQSEPSLEACWQVVEAKSGAVFAVACRVGAQLTIDDPDRLDHYNRFGHHLGVLVQIGDDAAGIWPPEGKPSDLTNVHRWTLPIAYAMAVSPPKIRTQLAKCLRTASQDPTAEIKARHLIEEAGTALYLTVEAERHRHLARLALEKACPPSTARNKLITFLDSTISLPSG